jgi:hypothetical protein
MGLIGINTDLVYQFGTSAFLLYSAVRDQAAATSAASFWLALVFILTSPTTEILLIIH